MTDNNSGGGAVGQKTMSMDVVVDAKQAMDRLNAVKDLLGEVKALLADLDVTVAVKSAGEEGDDCEDDSDCEDGCACNDDGECECEDSAENSDETKAEAKSQADEATKLNNDEAVLSAIAHCRDRLKAHLQ